MKSENKFHTAVIISGENPDLAIGELKAIMEIYNISYELFVDGLIVIVASSQPVLQIIKKRAALSILVGNLLFVAESISEFENNLKHYSFDFIKKTDSFAVRINKLKKSNYNSEILERKFGRIIKDKTGSIVSLTSPKYLFYVTISSKFYLIVNPTNTFRKIIFYDKMSKLKCPHPSVMNPILSVVMINLARASENSVVFDPFCGVGGIGARAIKLGIKFIGMDIMYNMVSCAMKNIGNNSLVSIIQGDARFLPLMNITHVVCDPPYGRSSSTKNRNPLYLLENFISELSKYLENNGFACIVFSANILTNDILDKILMKYRNIKLVENYFVYVHSGLTRRVMVFKKKE